jgi:hypothetical protein
VSDDPNYVREERTTIVEDTAPADTVYVERGSSATPWIIAAIVAVIAILAVVFLVNNRDDPVENADDIAAALDASRAAGYVEGATTTMSQMPPAPVLVPSYDSGAADRSAAEAAEAARDARDAAERAADSLANSPDTSVNSNTTP